LAERAILTPLNTTSDVINNAVLDMIPDSGQSERTLLSADSVGNDDDPGLYPAEILNGINLSGLPSHELRLRNGAVIILLRNIDQTRGLCNGTRLLLTSFTRFLIRATILSGEFHGTVALIPRIRLTPSDGRLPFTLVIIHDVSLGLLVIWDMVFVSFIFVQVRVQFPVRLAYCLSINKSQGQTLSRVGMYLPKHCFDHGLSQSDLLSCDNVCKGPWICVVCRSTLCRIRKSGLTLRHPRSHRGRPVFWATWYLYTERGLSEHSQTSWCIDFKLRGPQEYPCFSCDWCGPSFRQQHFLAVQRNFVLLLCTAL
jgi:hypothetical protein